MAGWLELELEWPWAARSSRGKPHWGPELLLEWPWATGSPRDESCCCHFFRLVEAIIGGASGHEESGGTPEPRALAVEDANCKESTG